MNKHLSKIIVSFLALAIFLAPISPILQSQNGHLAVDTKINKAEAESSPKDFTADVTAAGTCEGVDVTANIASTVDGAYASLVADSPYHPTKGLDASSSQSPIEWQISDKQDFSNIIVGNGGTFNHDNAFITYGSLGYTNTTLGPLTLTSVISADKKGTSPGPLTQTFGGFTAEDYSGKTLYVRIIMREPPSVILGNLSVTRDNITTKVASFQISKDPNCNPAETGVTSNQNIDGLKFRCLYGVFSVDIKGCMAGFFYFIWEAVSVAASFAGQFLDFFIYYSTNSASYVNSFIEQGWGAVRDVANIFFIIALLYIAIKTILSLNVSDNKKLIGAIVIIALLINFSLFFTKVVIDASNILAKVFYNNTDSVDAKGVPMKHGDEGQKSISVGLVDKFDPQNLISQDTYNNNKGSFIFFILFLIAITGYMVYMFFSVALLFVARVISLYISMIFAPVAFISYILPFKIPGFGHEEWWTDLLKNAFLAPIFIFMLYLIVMFAGFLKTIVATGLNVTSTKSFFQSLMHVAIPFIILFGLLMKAKELAVDYSGKIGAAISKVGAVVGGVALGAATGGLAIAGRATIGRAGSAIANSEKMKKWEAAGWGGGATKRLLERGSKASFDARNAKVAGKSLSDTGLKVGKGKEGGYEKDRKDMVEKRQKRAQGLEVGENEELKQDLNKTEQDLQELLKNNTKQIEDYDGKIKTAKDNNDTVGIKAAKAAKKVFLTGLVVTNGGANNGLNADQLIDQSNEQKSDILTENRDRKWNYASKRWGIGSKEAKHKIRMEDKLDTGAKT